MKKKNSKIFLIDDDKIYLFLAAKIIQKKFPEAIIKTYRNSQKIIGCIKNDPPDLMFLDINMPVLSGWDLLDEISKQQISITFPIYMVTSSIDPRDEERVKTANLIKGCILKPLTNEKLEQFANLFATSKQ